MIHAGLFSVLDEKKVVLDDAREFGVIVAIEKIEEYDSSDVKPKSICSKNNY